jgi:hypothetical protein
MPEPEPVVEGVPPLRPPVLARAHEESPGLGRTLVRFVAASTAIVLAVVTLGLMAAGTSLVDALGIGALAALWGGGGFGAMLGGVFFVHGADRSAPARSLVPAEDRAS